MAKCTFKFPLSAAAAQHMKVAREEIVAAKGSFEGNDEAGSFRIPIGIGDIEGEFTLCDGVLQIDITKKPLLVSCGVIEERLRAYISPTQA